MEEKSAVYFLAFFKTPNIGVILLEGSCIFQSELAVQNICQRVKMRNEDILHIGILQNIA